MGLEMSLRERSDQPEKVFAPLRNRPHEEAAIILAIGAEVGELEVPPTEPFATVSRGLILPVTEVTDRVTIRAAEFHTEPGCCGGGEPVPLSASCGGGVPVPVGVQAGNMTAGCTG